MIVCHSDKNNTGCGKCYHIGCIKRTVVPAGDWICKTCAQNIGEKVDIEGYEYLVHSANGDVITIESSEDEVDDTSNDASEVSTF